MHGVLEVVRDMTDFLDTLDWARFATVICLVVWIVEGKRKELLAGLWSPKDIKASESPLAGAFGFFTGAYLFAVLFNNFVWLLVAVCYEVILTSA